MEPDFGEELSKTAALLFTIIVIILLVLGVPSNTLVLWTLLKIKRLRRNQNFFVGNLAVSDFLITAYLLPFNLFFLLNKDAEIPSVLCDMNGVFTRLLFTSSVFSVTMIAMHRYIKICHYTFYPRIYTRKTVLVIIGGIWVIGLLFAMPFIWIDHSLIYDPTLQMCIYNRYASKPSSTAYFVICLYAPVTVTIVCYYKINAHVRKHKNNLSAWNSGFGHSRFRNDVRSTKMTFVVFVVYLALYSLFGVLATILYKHSQVSAEVHATSIYMAYANSCVNAYIYGFLNRDVYRAYKEALCCRKTRKILHRHAVELHRTTQTPSIKAQTASSSISQFLVL
ncbi:melatonin receptor type 1C-like [Saccostrea cucullata]|uniref:melatonin receptor type 1C-like n=1 Tax=Saccostrea cuccullata TaxID=36930 RepID=UPI002ED180FF